MACGTVSRRIVATAITGLITPTIARVIHPHQYAIGRPAGAEEMHKLTQILLERQHNAILSADVKSAFSDLHLDKLTHAIQQHCPEYEPLVRPWITANASYLCKLNDDEDLHLTSSRGVPMGCPMAAAAFALTLHTALDEAHNELATRYPDITINAYMGDINIITTDNSVDDVLRCLTSKLAAIGFTLNDTK